MVRLPTNLVYYSFTMSPAQCGSQQRLRILAGCVREASLAHPGGMIPPKAGQWHTENPAKAGNAFLTLTAVTKW